MKAKRIFFITIYIVLLFTSSVMMAQNNNLNKTLANDNDSESRFFTGGSLGLQYGMIEISPIIGYRLSKYFSVGMGATYQYINETDPNYGTSFKTSIYGGRVFARYYLLNNFIFEGEYELLSLESKYFDFLQIHNTKRFFENNVFIGGGYKRAFSENSCYYLMALYNVNATANNHYGTITLFGYDLPLVIRAGVEIGF